MGVGSHLEFVTTLFAWIMYKEIWAVLVDTALVFIPLVTMIAGNIISSRRAGDDEGSAGIQSLKKIETDFYVMLGVIVFAAIPVIDVTLGEMTYIKPDLTCKAPPNPVVAGNATGTTYDRTLTTLGDKTGQAPIWWATLHVLSKAVVSASIAGIPCAYDLASVEYTLAEISIDDPGLRKDLEEFTDYCYRPSRSRLLRSDTSLLTPEDLQDTLWLGSDYFQTQAGYYDTYYSYHAKPDFPFNAARDAGFEADNAAGGHPVCNQWWSDAGKGIRIRVLDSIDPAILDDMVYGEDALIKKATNQVLAVREREEVFLRKYLAVEQTKKAMGSNLPMSAGYRVTAVDKIKEAGWRDALGNGAGHLLNFIADGARAGTVAIGVALKSPAAIGEGYMIREGISMIQSLVLMLLVLLLPFLMLFSQYRVSVVITLSIMFFALHMLSLLWAVAYWMDNNLMSLMTEGSSYGVFEPMVNPTQSGIILWMGRFMYLIFPMIFFTALTWVGIQAGQIGNQVSSFGSTVGTPGAAGGQAVAAIATKGKG